MNTSKKTISLLVSGAFVASIAAGAAHAAENPFAIKSLSSGYMVADNDGGKMKDGKCSTGKCSASKKKKMESEAAASMESTKAKEGSCSADKMKEGTADKMKDGSCSADKMKDGSCHSDKK